MMSTELYQSVRNLFERLPDEGTIEYEKLIQKYSANCKSQDYFDVIAYMIDNDNDWSYEAFFVLCTFYRRNKDYSDMHQLIDRHPEFKGRLTYNHILIQYMVHSESFYDYEQLLELAYEDAEILKDNAGFQQAFCNAFATICEQCDEKDREQIVSKWYKKALEKIEHAIKLEPQYAKFYCTKARIISNDNRFREAFHLINKAISLESSSRPDYELAIMGYQNSKINIAILQQKMEFERKLAQINLLLNYANKSVGSSVLHKEEALCSRVNVYEGDEPYAFISYAHSDSEIVYPIIEKLHIKRIRLWYDKGIIPGEEWPEEIGRHLENCQVAIIMLSFNSVMSANVRREITMAINNKKKVIAILIDPVDLTPGMKLQLGLCQMLNTYQLSTGQLIDQLYSALARERCYE